MALITINQTTNQEQIQDFKLGGVQLENLAERREAWKFWGYFV